MFWIGALSLMEGGRLREVATHGGLVVHFKNKLNRIKLEK